MTMGCLSHRACLLVFLFSDEAGGQGWPVLCLGPRARIMHLRFVQSQIQDGFLCLFMRANRRLPTRCEQHNTMHAISPPTSSQAAASNGESTSCVYETILARRHAIRSKITTPSQQLPRMKGRHGVGTYELRLSHYPGNNGLPHRCKPLSYLRRKGGDANKNDHHIFSIAYG
ncbi:hypothetical protein B0J13DRAFT_259749 [Dactylonectria estremocensis]|uniref:Secreted protein n=1 Tax=Dactylonectria estremocensis TaxID=1079267 RepID=A0A9P9F364_9HYPO|nr:hypothetical protein B0J13DRAFT_259749 [Dactylonectria estremocensis]